MKAKFLGLGLGLGLAASLGINVYLAVLLVDAGIVLDNAKSEVDLLWQRREVALEILRRDWVGRPAAELDELASELEGRGIPVGLEGRTREIGDYLFEVEHGVVIEVRDLDSP